ncbi:hypothetical protein IFM89_006418 [Coptis chinensis]|uniref:glucose-6-phosphate dehydrogenase (NADP(+)) n=1 Tax=Coptis chinensis TaxID=261450 RepID=A0A835HS49_9MAGN|nr:hypothetical protein IFM89_006418 [Coptis chinensis]
MASGSSPTEKNLRSESFTDGRGEVDNVSETGCLSIVVLGASGDLAKKKTFPALYNLYRQGFLQSNEVHIFGYARTKISDDELRDRIRGYLSKGNDSEDVSNFLQLIKYVSGSYDGEEGFRLLDKNISEHEVSRNSQDGTSRRLFYLALPPSVYPSVSKMIRKFCMNNCSIQDAASNTQLIRNIPLGHDVVDIAFNKHARESQVLQSVMSIEDEEVVLGQYEGYTDDSTVSDHSNTPTFATVVLRIHNERWEGVPFILKAGKALNSRKAEIRVQFKEVPGDIFRCKKQGRNEFVIRLQPLEAMYMKLTVKQPGLEMSTIQSELDLSYGQRYQGVAIPEAYERLILDTYAAWEIFTPLLHKIDRGELKPLPYKPGSRGPVEADELLAKAGYVQTHGYIWIPPTL